MSNYNQNNGMQKRMIIMTVLVFVFFIAYEFLVLKPKQEEKAALAKIEQEKKQNAAPEVNAVVTQENKANLDAPKSSDSKIITKITTKNNIIEIDNLGRVSQVTLLEEKYKNDKGDRIKLFTAEQLKPLETRFADSLINEEAFKTPMVASSSELNVVTDKQELVLTQTLTNTVLTKKFTFYPDGHYDLTVSSTNDKNFFITNGFRPNVIADMYAVHGFMAKLNKKK